MTERKRNRRLILKYPTSNDSTTGYINIRSLNISSLRKARNPVMVPIFTFHSWKTSRRIASFSISMVHTNSTFWDFVSPFHEKIPASFKSSNLPLLVGGVSSLGRNRKKHRHVQGPPDRRGWRAAIRRRRLGREKKHRSEMLESVNILILMVLNIYSN